MQAYPTEAIIQQQEQLNYLTPPLPFEDAYIKVRDKEQRVFNITQIKQLPSVPPTYPHYKEWQMRATTANRFISYINKQKTGNLLDLGAGNGWFSHLIAKQCPSLSVTGIDINETELQQAVQAFQKSNLDFVYGDIFEAAFHPQIFQYITINSVLQYFPDPNLLLQRLFELLSPNGEIHILDSPFYHTHQIPAAQQRSSTYYTQMGVPEMAQYYHHLNWNLLQNYPHQILYQPNKFVNKVASKLGKISSPFPWIKIVKQ